MKILKGTHFEIEVKLEDTVADVKKNIETVQGSDVYPVAQQMLIHHGKVLKDGISLEENKVAENGFIVIMLTKHLAISNASSYSTSASSALKWDGGVSLVQGASRGIGLEFVKQLLQKNDKGHVIATCHRPNESMGLMELKSKFAQRLDILLLDLTILLLDPINKGLRGVKHTSWKDNILLLLKGKVLVVLEKLF